MAFHRPLQFLCTLLIFGGLTGCLAASAIDAAVQQTKAAFPTSSPYPTTTIYPTTTGYPTETTQRYRIITPTLAPAYGSFEPVAEIMGLGGLLSTTLVPEVNDRPPYLYLSLTYPQSGFDLLGINLENGETAVYTPSLTSETGAWGLIADANGDMYLGSYPNAHLFRLNRESGKLVDLGRLGPQAQIIWQLCWGSDGKLYAVTYPDARLFRFDPQNGAIKDLGRMSEDQPHARQMATSKDGFVYVSTGLDHASLVAYEIKTGYHSEILPSSVTQGAGTSQNAGLVNFQTTKQGEVIATLGEQSFRLEKFQAMPLENTKALELAENDRLADGRKVGYFQNEDASAIVQITGSQEGTNKIFPITYPGKQLNISHLTASAEAIFAVTSIPAYLLRFSPVTTETGLIARLGDGDIYSLESDGESVFLGGYQILSTFLQYKPGLPFKNIEESAPNPTPLTITQEISNPRLKSLVIAPDGTLFGALTSALGTGSSQLLEKNPQDETSLLHTPLVEATITSLTAYKDLIIGGFKLLGETATDTSYPPARIFLWDRSLQRNVATVEVNAASGPIDALIASEGGILYGIAKDALIVYDLKERTLIKTSPLPFLNVVPDSLVADKQGRIWGLANSGVFLLDTQEQQIFFRAQSPQPITAGTAYLGDYLYFVSQDVIYRYRMPPVETDES